MQVDDTKSFIATRKRKCEHDVPDITENPFLQGDPCKLGKQISKRNYMRYVMMECAESLVEGLDILFLSLSLSLTLSLSLSLSFSLYPSLSPDLLGFSAKLTSVIINLT
eukprot:sb/3477374/